MEPPPRLYHYEGLFTSVRSIDLPLKILTILLVVISLIVFAAWLISRKTYRRAPKYETLDASHITDLRTVETSRMLLRNEYEWQCGVFTGNVCGRLTLLVNDWKLICLYETEDALDYHYSAAPGSFRRKWYGLWLSDYTLSHRPHLRAIVFHTFDTLSPNTFPLIGSFTVKSVRSGQYPFGEHLLESSALDTWIWDLVLELVFFNSPDFVSLDPDESNCRKHDLLQCLRKRLLQLLEVHYCGKIRSGNFSNPNTLITELEQLVSPLIRHAIETFMHYCGERGVGSELPRGSNATSLLHQFVQAHHQLEQEGEFVGFLSPVHMTHLLVEISLILHCCILRALRVLFVVLALRTDWQSRLREEARRTMTDGVKCPRRPSKSAGPLLPHSCFHLKHIDCLAWTKALVNEAIRFSAPGFPLCALREAARDGKLLDFDYAEGELILFNQLVYFNDQQLWETDRTPESGTLKIQRKSEQSMCHNHDDTNDSSLPGLPFNPHRFLKPLGSTETGDRVQLELPVHWARHMLVGYTVCVPNDCVYRLLTVILTHLFGTGLTVSTKSGVMSTSDADGNNVLWLPQNSPSISWTYTPF